MFSRNEFISFLSMDPKYRFANVSSKYDKMMDSNKYIETECAVGCTPISEIEKMLYSYLMFRSTCNEMPIYAKLAKLSRYSLCQIENCNCEGWTIETETNKLPDFMDKCNNEECNHTLLSHITQYNKFFCRRIDHLHGYALDLINITRVRKYIDNGDIVKLYDDLMLRINIAITSNLKPILLSGLGQPPFEKPSIEEAISVFATYKYYTKSRQKVIMMHNVGKLLINFINSYTFPMPKIPGNDDPKHPYIVEYVRWYAFCFIPVYCKSYQQYEATAIFGRTLLRALFCNIQKELTQKCVGKCSAIPKDKWSLILQLPSFVADLRAEVFKKESPIWNTEYNKNSLKLTMELVEPSIAVQKSNMDYEPKENIINTNTSLMNDINFMSNTLHHWRVAVGTNRAVNVRTIELDLIRGLMTPLGSSDVLTEHYLIEILAIYHKQYPFMNYRYIKNRLFSPYSETLVLLKSNKVIGGITFRVRRGALFTEIVFCGIGEDSTKHNYYYEWILISYLKKYSNSQRVWHILTYADKRLTLIYEKEGFTDKIGLEKIFYADLMKNIKNTKLLYCKLEPDELDVSCEKENIYKVEVINEEFKEYMELCKTTISKPILHKTAVCYLPLEIEPIQCADVCSLKAILRSILEELLHVKGSEMFLLTENPANMPAYYKKVKFPIYLNTINERLKDGYYTRAAEFKNDVLTMIFDYRENNKSAHPNWEYSFDLERCLYNNMMIYNIWNEHDNDADTDDDNANANDNENDIDMNIYTDADTYTDSDTEIDSDTDTDTEIDYDIAQAD